MAAYARMARVRPAQREMRGRQLACRSASPEVVVALSRFGRAVRDAGCIREATGDSEARRHVMR